MNTHTLQEKRQQYLELLSLIRKQFSKWEIPSCTPTLLVVESWSLHGAHGTMSWPSPLASTQIVCSMTKIKICKPSQTPCQQWTWQRHKLPQHWFYLGSRDRVKNFFWLIIMENYPQKSFHFALNSRKYAEKLHENWYTYLLKKTYLWWECCIAGPRGVRIDSEVLNFLLFSFSI